MYNKDNVTKLNKMDGLAPSEMIAVLEPRRNSPCMTTGHDRPSPGQNLNSNLDSTTIPNLAAVKAKQKATWESGDFGQIARSIEDVAEEFMAGLHAQPTNLGHREPMFPSSEGQERNRLTAYFTFVA